LTASGLPAPTCRGRNLFFFFLILGSSDPRRD
jgi:hypothetical protein